MSAPPIYGLDVCIRTGLDDPRPATRSPGDGPTIRAIGLSTSRGDELYTGAEAEILQLVDHRLAVLPPGVIVTWQGSILDLPLVERRSTGVGLHTGLRLRPDHRPAPPSPLHDLDHAWCADWYGHGHLELRRVYEASERWWHPRRGGFDPESLMPPVDDHAVRDPRKDARLARSLAERRWPKARRLVDRMPERHGWVPGRDRDARSAR